MKKKNIFILLTIGVIAPFSGIFSSEETVTSEASNATATSTAAEKTAPANVVAQKAFFNFMAELYKDIHGNIEELDKKLVELPKTLQLKTLQKSYEDIITSLQASLHKLQHKHPRFTQKLQNKIRTVLANLKAEFKKIIATEETRKYGQANWKDILKVLKQKIDTNLKDNFHQFIEKMEPHIKNIQTITTPAIKEAGKAIQKAVGDLQTTFSQLETKK